ncbi:MAG: hypothetical protein KKE57_07860 [Proteobacteria bacterium]|nr:hypothetical protein [Pseudomonadota bacterium]
MITRQKVFGPRDGYGIREKPPSFQLSPLIYFYFIDTDGFLEPFDADRSKGPGGYMLFHLIVRPLTD